jgi:hypothetical protein
MRNLWKLRQLHRYSDGLWAGWLKSKSRQGQEILTYFTVSTPALEPTQPPIQRVPGALSPGVKRLGDEAGHSPPCIAKVKNGGAIPPLPHMPSWHGTLLIRHRDNFTFTFMINLHHLQYLTLGSRFKPRTFWILCLEIMSIMSHDACKPE